MNMYDYLDKYGIYSFEEKPFNEIDSIIFSFFSYVDFNGIFDEKNIISLKDVGRIHFGLYKMSDKHILAVREANKMFHYMKDTKRYKDCLLFNYEYIVDNEKQFSVISIEYMKNKVFVSFEGTDQNFSGWKEDFILSYKFPTISQFLAIDYMNKNYTFSNKELIVGGHSKGGNLALVAGMCSNFLVRLKIKNIINADGPGLLKKQINSKKFKRILPKYRHYIPDSSVVGILLQNSNDIVIKSSVQNILSHDIYYWVIDDDGKFVKSELSLYSIKLRKQLDDWLDKYNDIDMKTFVDNLDYLFRTAGIVSIIQLRDDIRNVIKLISDSKVLDNESKKMLNELMIIFIKVYGDSKIEELRKSFHDKINNFNYKI